MATREVEMEKCQFCKDDVEEPCQTLDEAISGGCLPVPCKDKRLSYEVLERAKSALVVDSKVDPGGLEK